MVCKQLTHFLISYTSNVLLIVLNLLSVYESYQSHQIETKMSLQLSSPSRVLLHLSRMLVFMSSVCVISFFLSGIAPVYCSLFGLMRESDRIWFAPNHIFKLHQPASESLQFRIRWIYEKQFCASD